MRTVNFGQLTVIEMVFDQGLCKTGVSTRDSGLSIDFTYDTLVKISKIRSGQVETGTKRPTCEAQQATC